MHESVPVQLTRGLWGTRSMSHCRTWTFLPLVLADKVQTFKLDQAVLPSFSTWIKLSCWPWCSGVKFETLHCLCPGLCPPFLCLVLAQWELVLLIGAGTVTPHLTPDWSLWWSVFVFSLQLPCGLDLGNCLSLSSILSTSERARSHSQTLLLFLNDLWWGRCY